MANGRARLAGLKQFAQSYRDQPRDARGRWVRAQGRAGINYLRSKAKEKKVLEQVLITGGISAARMLATAVAGPIAGLGTSLAARSAVTVGKKVHSKKQKQKAAKILSELKDVETQEQLEEEWQKDILGTVAGQVASSLVPLPFSGMAASIGATPQMLKGVKALKQTVKNRKRQGN